MFDMLVKNDTVRCYSEGYLLLNSVFCVRHFGVE